MEFRLLGPLEAVAGDRPASLGGPKQRAVLAVLLLRANEIVPVEALAAAVWGSGPPSTAGNTLQVYVSNLRRALEEVEPGSGGLLVTRRPGYVVEIDAERLDAARFARLSEQGREALASGDPEAAAVALREALSLWRGPVLPEVGLAGWADQERARLDELRVASAEDLVDAELARGRHVDVVGELERLVAEHPLRERPRGQLMLAFYRSGRQAEALEAYRDARRALDEQLGLEPSPALVRLERAILVQDPSLEAPSVRPLAGATPAEALRDVRKTVTALVAELGVDVERALELDPETLDRVLDGMYDGARAAIERHGGTVDRSRPDGLTALFGSPSLHEDDPLRAVRASSELVEHSPRARVGIATGPALVREGPNAPQATGQPLLAAARLQSRAGEGQILLAESTLQLVRDAVQVEPVDGEGGFLLLEVAPREPGVRRRLDAPMLGREKELGLLRKAFRRSVRAKRCVVVAVLGQAGIGKSRLAEELRSTVADDADVLVGRCLSYGDGITFWPLAEVLMQALGDDLGSGIEGFLGERDDGPRAARLVAAALGLAEGGAGREETFWAMRQLIEALAARRPLVLVFDDVHWAEPTFLEFVDHLLEVSRRAPLLVVCLARPELLELRPAWAAGEAGVDAVELEPLSEAESRLLISNLLGGKELPAAVANRIALAAEGNPLFVEQLLGMLVDDGLLRIEDGRWVAPHELPEQRVPPTIEALVAARLDRLPREERDVIEAASVVGKVFSPGALTALARDGNRETVGALLDALVRRGLIADDHSRVGGEQGFRFQHLLIREAAYHSLPKRGRAGLHERLADWLERSMSGPELDELIGYHLEQAHRYRAELGPLDDAGLALAPRAGERLGPAGRRAFAHGDVPGAVNLLGRAAALLPDGHAERPEILLVLADAVHEAGDAGWAESVLEEVRRIAAASNDRRLAAHASVLELRMQILFDPAVTTERLLRGAERAVEVFEETVDHDGLSNAWFVLAWIPWLRCQAAMAERALERAAEHAWAAGDERAFASAKNLHLGAALQGPTPVSEAVARCETALAAPDTPQRVQACALRVLAVLRAMEGRFDEARELVARDREILEALGRRLLLATVSEAHALVELLAGEPLAAEKILGRGAESLEAMGERGALSTVAALRAEAALALGDADAALRHSETSERTAAPEDFMSQVLWRRPKAKLLAARGEAEEAERTARKAVELARRTDFPTLQGEALVALAEVFRQLDRAEEAVEPVEEAIRLFEAKGNAVAAGRARRLLAELKAPVSGRK